MDLAELSVAISDHLASRTGVFITVEMSGHTATLRGRIPSADAHKALLYLAAELMPRWQLVDALQVQGTGSGIVVQAGEWVSVDVGW